MIRLSISTCRRLALALVVGAAFFAVAANLSPCLAASGWRANPSSLFSAGDKISTMIFGVFMGVVLTAAAYLFFIWIVMRDRGQVSLFFLLLCLGAYIAGSNEILMGPEGLNTARFTDSFTNYSLILSCICSVLFTYYFLEVDANSPLLRMPLFSLVGLLMIFLVYAVFDQTLARFLLPAISTFTIAFVLTAGLACFREEISGSLVHVIAFLFFLTGTLSESLYALGFIRTAGHANDVTYISFSLAATMFSIVIASQFAARQEEKEKALATSNERFALATRGANEGLFDWNLGTGEVFFSDQFRKIIGMRLENKSRSLKTWMRFIVPSDRRIVREALRRFRRNSEVNIINIEYRIAGKDDVRRWMHSKAVAVRDPATKKIVRLVGSTSDVTPRKQSEVALRASETRFRSITEAHPVPVMIVSLQAGVIMYASPGAEELLGQPQGQLVNQSFHRFLTGLEEREDIWDSMKNGKDVNLKEVHLQRSNDTVLTAALSARRISYQDEDSMVIGLYDLTERKQAEAQIALQQEALQQSEKMAALGGLLAGVAHELNNPLSVVVGQSTLLMEGSPEPGVVARAEKIFKSADRCARIVKSFLALARRKPPERKPVDINGIIHAALDLLGYQIRTENIDVVQNLEPQLPEITGDGDQLTQIITNLILNATQAMQNWKGTRRITIRTWRDGDKVSVSVADTGPGVPADIRTRIFEPFFTTKGGQGGTGVGLSLCINIAASHGGQLYLEDTPGGGATFVVALPLTTEVAGIKDVSAPATAVLPKNLKLLIVDDEVELAQTLADLLDPEGHHVDIAINGAVAMEKLHKAPYDVIISDLRMPVMDGPGLYAAMQREAPAYLGKIIYVTGDTLSTHVQSFLQEHPVPVIEKPYRLNDVRAAIANIVKDSASAGISA
ncbi:MAG: ATP-binding protein [Alphaproteobacteria bacterium]|nr:ATP-binding protein [Alphaproteobacteria bacterium]